MDIAGHPTIEMTMNVYGHVSLDEKRAALDELGKLFGEESDPVAVRRCSHGGDWPGCGRRSLGLERTKPQIRTGLPTVLLWRACRDSNPKPSDP